MVMHPERLKTQPSCKYLAEVFLFFFSVNYSPVWSTVPSVRHHPGSGRDGNSPSVPGTLPTFGSWTETDGKDGRGRSGAVPGGPRPSSTDIHGPDSMYAIYT